MAVSVALSQVIFVLPDIQEHGSHFNNKQIAAYKPTAVPNGTVLTFGTDSQKLKVLCEQTGGCWPCAQRTA